MKDYNFAQQTMQEIVGEQLNTVTFGVFDHLSLEFNGPSFVAHNPVSLRVEDQTFRFGDKGFCDALCGLLGQVIADVQISGEELKILFSNRTYLAMSLREADYSGPEAGTYYSAKKEIMVF